MDVPAPYPVVLDLRAARVLVLGAGRVALQKLKGLPKGLASVRIFAPQARPALRSWLKRRPEAAWLRRPLRAGDLKGCRLLFCCSDDPRANARAAALARARGVWVCQAAEPSQGDLRVPSTFKAAGLGLTLSTGGASPALAKALRQRLQKQLNASDLAWLLAQLARRRQAFKADPRAKAALLRRLLGGRGLDLALAPRRADRRRALMALFRS
ncbi:MAG TPA: NAD(P)-dependent oxidoreductase [bacterium]|jgi:siroheme synthase-like protein|nr:NAD(P)-dependent oxidoreductase [bacterium]